MPRRRKVETVQLDVQPIPGSPAEIERGKLRDMLARLRTAAGSTPLKITAVGGGITGGPLGLEQPDLVLIGRHDVNEIIRRLSDTTP